MGKWLLLHLKDGAAVLPLPSVAVHAECIRAEGVGPSRDPPKTEACGKFPAEGAKEVLDSEVAHTEPDTAEEAVHVAHGAGHREGRPGVLVLLAIPAFPADGTRAKVGFVVRVHAEGVELQVGGRALDGWDDADGGTVRGATAESTGEHSPQL